MGDIENIMTISVDFCINASYNSSTEIYELAAIWRRLYGAADFGINAENDRRTERAVDQLRPEATRNSA